MRRESGMPCRWPVGPVLALGLALLPAGPQPVRALSTTATGRETILAGAETVCVGTVKAMSCFHPPGSDAIHTRVMIGVRESLRGNLPSTVALVYRGGTLGRTCMADSSMPDLAVGDVRVFCLEAQKDGTFGVYGDRLGVWPVEGSNAPIRGRSVTADGLQSPHRRLTGVDRGDPIGVIADISTRPAGITEAEALTALANALAAWEAVTYITFQFDGTEVFAQPVTSISDGSGRLRVQLHDNWGEISDTGSILGFGGSFFSGESASGGEFLGRTFRSISSGYIVLDHPKDALSNVVTLEEVLAHEIGHTLGLSHSSETDPEFNGTKREALMYYLAHKDGRGADPRPWDVDALRRAYPTDNTPPFSFDRYLLAVTSPGGTLAHPEVNQVQLTEGDVEGDTVTIDVVGSSSGNGSWSRTGATVTYTPAGWFSDASVADPLTESFDRFQYRISDGSAYSGIRTVSIVGFRSDTVPSGLPDGLPDSWMQDQFGSMYPVAGTSGTSDDVDQDRLTTLQEFLVGSVPTDAASGCTIGELALDPMRHHVRYTALPYVVVELQASLDGGSTWTTLRYQQRVHPDPAVADLYAPATPAAQTLYRLRTRH